MTDREIVERLRAFIAKQRELAQLEVVNISYDEEMLIVEASDRIEQTLAPPEGDTVSALSTSFRLVMTSVYLMCKDGRGNEAADMLAERAIAALQSRVSPDDALIAAKAERDKWKQRAFALECQHGDLQGVFVQRKAEPDAEGGEA